MNSPKKSILFIGPGASRTGAPIASLHLVRWLIDHADVGGCYLLGSDGPLASEFCALLPTVVLSDSPWASHRPRAKIFNRLNLGGWAASRHKRLVLQQLIESPDLVFCNTLLAGKALEMIDHLDAPIVVHVHELEMMFRIEPDAMERVVRRADRFIACSHAVAKNLIEQHGVHANAVDVIHEAVATRQVDFSKRDKYRAALRCRLGADTNEKIVLGCGSLGWRKGSDLFVQVAAKVLQEKRQSVRFVWLGDPGMRWEHHEYAHDVETLGLTSRIHHLPAQPDPFEVYLGSDVFVLPSREDPYPLVCLEAASCGLPVICFAGGGGMPEFVEDDCGKVVPYLDTNAMAEAIKCLLADDQRRIELGAWARQKVQTKHDIEVAGPAFVNVIERAVALPVPI